METFDYFYGVNVLELFLRYTDNLSQTLQSSSMTVCHCKNIAALTTKTQQSLSSDVSVSSFWEKILIDAKNYNVNDPSLPQKCKRLARFLNEGETNAYDEIGKVVIFYLCIHYYAIDTLVT